MGIFGTTKESKVLTCRLFNFVLGNFWADQ